MGLRQISFAKRGEDWFLTAPLEERADSSAVSSLLTSLDTAAIEEFVAETVVEDSDYGLANPAGVVRVREAGAESWQTIEIGAEAESEGHFARDAARDPIVRIKPDLLTALGKDLFEFRDKDIIDVQQDTIARLRLQRPEGELAIRHADFKWIIESPDEQKDQEALAYKFWYPIDDMEFETIDEAGVGDFSNPDVTLIVELTDGSTLSFQFVEEESAYRARRESDGRQGRISKESFDKLLVGAGDLG